MTGRKLMVQGEEAMLLALAAQGMIHRLFVNRIEPSAGTRLSDMHEMEGAGYRPIRVSANAWSLVHDPTGLQGGWQEWVFDEPSEETGIVVYGHYLSCHDRLVDAERFPKPSVIRLRGDKIRARIGIWLH